jgi:cytochrome c oxidase subunit IV
MSHEAHKHEEHSRTSEAIAHGHNPFREYFIVYGVLLALLFITVAATWLPTTEPWSFLIALLIAVIKAVLVILFFMHVKDASRVTWVFCGCSFLWLLIMLVLTFGDYMTRVKVGAPPGQAQAAQSQIVQPSHE